MARETAAERAAREALEPPKDWADQPVNLALVRVMRDVRELGKLDRNEESPDGGFAFRGIDAVVNAVGPILRKHGVLCLPTLLKADLHSADTRGSVAVAAFVKVRYTFIGPQGDRLRVEVPGEAMDFGDKAVNKAMSVAWRTCLLHSLQIPTGEKDPDAYSYQRTTGDGQQGQQGGSAGRQQSNGQRGGQQADPRLPVRHEIGRLLTQLGVPQSSWHGEFFRWSEGKQADHASLALLTRYRDHLAERVTTPPEGEGSAAEQAAEQAATEMLQDQLGAEPVTEGGE